MRTPSPSTEPAAERFEPSGLLLAGERSARPLPRLASPSPDWSVMGLLKVLLANESAMARTGWFALAVALMVTRIVMSEVQVLLAASDAPRLKAMRRTVVKSAGALVVQTAVVTGSSVSALTE
jgi:hypothetical protein